MNSVNDVVSLDERRHLVGRRQIAAEQHASESYGRSLASGQATIGVGYNTLINYATLTPNTNVGYATFVGHVLETTQTQNSGTTMSDPTREEIDAKLAAVEARTEARFVELSGKIDRVIDAISRSNTDFTTVAGQLRKEMGEVKTDNKNTRWTITATMILALLAAIAALWLTQGNLLAAFQASLTLHEISNNQPPIKPTATPTH
jgi:hypothetical protein